MFEIIKGKIFSATKTVLYGPEGIGKSTFASNFPEPLFIDTEGSTKNLDVKRFEKPTSWQMLLDMVQYVKDNKPCKTLVIDTMDWAEQLCTISICDKYSKKGIEDFGYGNGYVYVKEEIGRFLNLLQDVVDNDINVCLTAHSQIRKFEQPEETGAYDRYELKLGKKTGSQTAPIVKEWSDMLLFANYEIFSIATDDKGKHHKAQGGARVMYTSHNPCWDAKNRFGLPEKLNFDYSEIKNIIEHENSLQSTTDRIIAPKIIEPESKIAEKIAEVSTEVSEPKITVAENAKPELSKKIPKALRDLMQINNVTEWDIQNVVGTRGYYPSDVSIADYDPEFINGVLISAWDGVFKMIKELKKNQEIPFQ